MQAGPSNDAFGFSAKPQVVKARSKYREPVAAAAVEEEARHQNVMFDKHVVRGNTYARIITSKDTTELNKDLSKSGRPLKRTIQIENTDFQREQQQQEVGTPRPVHGRLHQDVQTDQFVETLTDKPPHYEKDTQTEVFIDRPNPRLFMPKKTGLDQETQIWDGDLFDFDYEVEPILQVLLGKTLELSRMEVLEEEELRVMKEQQKRFEQLKNAELAEMQRLEAKEKRLFEENERRKLQHRKQREQNIVSHKKMISRSMAKVYLKKLQGNVVDTLEDQGVFRNPLEISLYDDFLPWLYTNVSEELREQAGVDSAFEELCEELVKKCQDIHLTRHTEEMEMRENIRKEKRRVERELEEKRERKRLARLRKIEMERRNRLRDDVAARILSKADLKDSALQQLISDIDGNQQEGRPFVGLVGGLVGEFVLFLSALANSDDSDLASQISSLINNTESVVGVFRELLVSVLSEGQLDLPINSVVDELLDKKVNDLTLATLASASLGDDQEEVMEIISSNVYSLILNEIKAKEAQINFPVETIDLLVQSIIQAYFSDEEQRQKIKLSSVKYANNFRNAQGIAYVCPDVTTLTLNPKSVRAGLEPEIGEDEEPIKLIPENLVESEFQNKVSLFVAKDDDLEVLVQHAVAEQVVREDILRILANSIKGIDGREYNILFEAYEKTQANQKLILDSIHNDFPVFDMKSY